MGYYYLIMPNQSGIPISQYFGPAGLFPNVGVFVNVLLKNVLTLAGVVAFLAVVYTGIRFISSSGDAKAQEQNKGAFTAAIFGLIIIFGAYGIVEIAQTILGYNLLSPQF